MTDVIVRAESAKKRLKYARAKVTRLKLKVKSLQEVVNDLRQKDKISATCEAMLAKTFSGVPLTVMRRIVQQKSSRPTHSEYPEELKSFALTLSFYSLKAYKYVREHFQLALPHPSTLRRWYKGLNCQPGFTDEAFAALALRVAEGRQQGHPVVCGLVFDEMAIRKHIEWNGTKFVGYVDVGTNIDDDSVPVATEALVFMVVALNGCWKVPVGYFLIDGLNGDERANLVNQCLLKLYDIGVVVASVTCDGPSCNFAMFSSLGVQLQPPDIKPAFQHPADPALSVYVILDACHMLKLVRNCFASYGIMKDDKGDKINWNYIEQLHKLQESEGLRLGNKIRAAHVLWKKQKMKVNLAAQTLSSSVADALEFCCVSLKLPQFSGCEATIRFLRLIDRLFDVLNSRNPLAKGYKGPMRPANAHIWQPFLETAKTYLLSITNATGQLMYTTKRKTPFLGLVCTVQSLQSMYSQYVGKDGAVLKYLLTYKVSQDHIELFFGALRSSCGSNNNPTVRQFTAAYKRLLMRHNVQGGLGNVVVQDETRILNVTLDSIQVEGSVQQDTLDMAVARLYDLSERSPLQYEHDYADVPNSSILNEYKHAVVGYIAGYVVRMVKKKVHCAECQIALMASEVDPIEGSIGAQFINLKNRGGLVKPSSSVLTVCEETEKCFQRMYAMVGNNLPQTRHFLPAITNVVLSAVGHKCFASLETHMFDSTVDNNHVFNLIKCIAQCYSNIRLHHLAKQKTFAVSGATVRKELSKLILFKHQ